MSSCIPTMRHGWSSTESVYKYMYIASGKVLRFYYWVLMKTRFVVHDRAEPPEHSPSDNSTRPIGQRSFGWNGFQVFSRRLLFFSVCVCVCLIPYIREQSERQQSTAFVTPQLLLPWLKNRWHPRQDLITIPVLVLPIVVCYIAKVTANTSLKDARLCTF